jgi:hypothetical protein
MASAYGFGYDREKPEIEKNVCNGCAAYENGAFNNITAQTRNFEMPKPSVKSRLFSNTA